MLTFRTVEKSPISCLPRLAKCEAPIPHKPPHRKTIKQQHFSISRGNVSICSTQKTETLKFPNSTIFSKNLKMHNDHARHPS